MKQDGEIAVAVLDVLSDDAIRYIGGWVDRTRRGTGLAYELGTVSLSTLGKRGTTTLGFLFPSDDNSYWWGRFLNPDPRAPANLRQFWPVAFGREQR
jgi:hypothetical protein